MLSDRQQTELKTLKQRFQVSSMKQMTANNTATASLDLLSVWQPTDDLAELYAQLSEMKVCLDSFRPLNKSMVKNLNEVLDVRYTYESNGIEGNSLTLSETSRFIQTGLTVGGKPLVDHLEVINHQDAIQYIRELAQDNIELSEREVKQVHALILKGIQDQEAGLYRKQPVYILQQDGTRHEFPQPFIVPKLMEDFFVFFDEQKDVLHPVAMAAHLHQKLVNIHPFIDGNGRTSRLVMNLYLFQQGYPVAIIESEPEKRRAYYQHLSDYRGVLEGGDSEPFQLFVAQKVKESLVEHLNFFAQDLSNEAENKGYVFFKHVEALF